MQINLNQINNKAKTIKNIGWIYIITCKSFIVTALSFYSPSKWVLGWRCWPISWRCLHWICCWGCCHRWVSSSSRSCPCPLLLTFFYSVLWHCCSRAAIRCPTGCWLEHTAGTHSYLGYYWGLGCCWACLRILCFIRFARHAVRPQAPHNHLIIWIILCRNLSLGYLRLRCSLKFRGNPVEFGRSGKA